MGWPDLSERRRLRATFRTGFGEPYRVERRLPRLAWRPRWRGPDSGWADLGSFPDEGPFAIVGVIIGAIFLVIFGIPLLLLVAEVATVLAIVLPLGLLALAVGLVKHTVLLRRGAGEHATVVARREVRGVPASILAARQLRAAAEGGEFRRAAGVPGEPPGEAAV